MAAYHLPSASYRIGKFGGVIQSESKGLRTRRAKGISPSPSLKTWEPEPMSEGRGRWKCYIKQREQICSPSVFLFYSGPQGIGWCQSTWVRIDSVYQFICQTSSGNTLTDTPRNNILPASEHPFSPVKLTYKTNHHKHHIILFAVAL